MTATPAGPSAVILPIAGADSGPTIEGLARQTVPPGKIVHVDQLGDFTESLRAAAGWDPRWVWLLDSGVVPEPPALERLLAARERLEGKLAPVLLASKVLTSAGALDRTSLPVPEVYRPEVVLEALERHLVAIRVARRGSLLVDLPVLQEIPVRSTSAVLDHDLEWTARLLKGSSGVLVPSSVVVRLHAPAPSRIAWLPRSIRLMPQLERRERLWFFFHLLEEAASGSRR